MRIIFLCSSLEPGKDGVGDFTRKLASELILQGSICNIVALMDKFVSEETEEWQMFINVSIQVLRLPFKNGYKNNCTITKNWLGIKEPDWISIQYVPFGFQNKGLPLFLGRCFKKLTQDIRVHIMFHELWVGMNQESSFKLKTWGYLQKKIIYNFIINIKPSIISTQSQLYRYQLYLLGFRANLLPLFSNIPFIKNTNSLKKSNVIRFVVFGNIHYGSPVGAFVKDLKDYLLKTKQNAEINFVGKCGNELDIWKKNFNEFEIVTKDWGIQDVVTISNIMQAANFGIVATPYILIEKSGSYAAMLEHQLPVIILSRQWSVKGYAKNALQYGTYEYQQSNKLDQFLNDFKDIKITRANYNVANTFLASLK